MTALKIVGYIIALLGLAGIAFSKKIASLSLLASFGTKAYVYTLIGSVVLILIGIAFTLTKSSEKVAQATEEVPIYQGEGKERKIVAYKKASKK
jgi:hypothetical protein